MNKTQVYFDGACHLCSREIEHYRLKDKLGRMEFVDITDPQFSAPAAGLDPQRVNEIMHVRDEAGKLHLGVDGFFAIWNCLPGYERLIPIVKAPGIYQLAKLGYAGFARLRPYLPKRKSAHCDDGTCRR